MNAVAVALHGRSREMIVLQYLTGMILLHCGCTYRDIERLAKIGVTVTADTLSNKLATWQDGLDADLVKLRDTWGEVGSKKYQLVGDNWDKSIVPSFRSSQQKTLSLHLFNIIGEVDRVPPANYEDISEGDTDHVASISDLNSANFIPSMGEQNLLCDELSFLVATSIITNIDKMTTALGRNYPKHLQHQYSEWAGIKTQQHMLGLFDCNETKTQEVIRLMKELTKRYVPMRDDDIVEEVFFGGDILTDERIKAAQEAMLNSEKASYRFEGFISKIEDFHRLMNFLEAITKLTYNTTSGKDRGTAYYYRNVLNARNVKSDVKNSYRAYTFLYYTMFDGICCALFLKEMQGSNIESVELPQSWKEWTNQENINWINCIAKTLVTKCFFEEDQDLLKDVRDILSDPEHPENYWTSTTDNGGFKCHYCNKTYTFAGSLKAHEKTVHDHNEPDRKREKSPKKKDVDELYNYVLLLFRLTSDRLNIWDFTEDSKRASDSQKIDQHNRGKATTYPWMTMWSSSTVTQRTHAPASKPRKVFWHILRNSLT